MGSMLSCSCVQDSFRKPGTLFLAGSPACQTHDSITVGKVQTSLSCSWDSPHSSGSLVRLQLLSPLSGSISFPAGLVNGPYAD